MERFAFLEGVTALSGPSLARPETSSYVNLILTDGEAAHLCERYAGKVVMAVNAASRCAVTPQYAGLEVLLRA